MHHILEGKKQSCEQNVINRDILEIQNLSFWFYAINQMKYRKPSFPSHAAIILYLKGHILPWEESYFIS